MANFALVLVNGVPRMQALASNPPIYDETITIVSSGGDGTDTVNGPVTTGTALTLPSSGTYTVASGVTALNIYLNGQKLEYSYDWSISGSGPNYTQFTVSQDLQILDILELRQERST